MKRTKKTLPFSPAYLSKSKHRWEIRFTQTNPATQKREPQRETWDINRITEKKHGKDWERLRMEAAKAAIKQINEWLPKGYPYVSPDEIKRLDTAPTVLQAFTSILDIKTRSDKQETNFGYKSIGGVFLAWLKSEKYESMLLENFTKRHAIQFMDYLTTRTNKDGTPLSNRTWNNYKINISGFWNEMKSRELTNDNPFATIKAKRVLKQTSRRKFLPEERVAMAEYLIDNDIFLFWAVVLEFYGLFRGTEIRRLRPRDFDFTNNLIYLEAAKSKTGNERWVTMSPFMKSVFMDPRFLKIPANYLIFGFEFKPNPTKSLSKNTLNHHHRKALLKLKDAGKLDDITGLSLYSWKNTGITHWLKLMPLVSVMNQAGHTDPATTLIYNEPDRVSQDFMKLDQDITQL